MRGWRSHENKTARELRLEEFIVVSQDSLLSASTINHDLLTVTTTKTYSSSSSDEKIDDSNGTLLNNRNNFIHVLKSKKLLQFSVPTKYYYNINSAFDGDVSSSSLWTSL